jgi:hypothetical protein
MCVNHGAPETLARKYHITYLIQIPWQPGATEQFAQKLSRFWQLQQAAENYSKDAAEILSNNPDAVLLGCDGVIAMNVGHIENLTISTNNPFFTFNAYKCPEFSRELKHLCKAECVANCSVIETVVERHSSVHLLLLRLGLLLRQAQLLLLEENHNEALRSSPCIQKEEFNSLENTFPARSAPRENTSLVIGVPCVSPHFLEKQELRWFSLQHLEQWMQNPPVQEGMTMRRSFRPVMYTVLQYFAELLRRHQR